MSQPLTSDQAIALLREHPDAYLKPESLRSLAARVDADAPGKLTVLYSGPTTKDVWSSDVIKAMTASGEDVRVIDNSQAAKFLQSEDFYHAVAKSYGLTDFRSLADGTYRGPATDWLYDAKAGPWADASTRFVDATHGEVRVIASDARPDRVFGAVELPRALANPNITTIEDVPRELLAAREAKHGTQAAFEMVVSRARDNVGRLDLAVNYAGTPLRENGVLQMDCRAYCVGTSIKGRAPGFTSVTRPLGDHFGPPSSYVLAGQQQWHSWQAEVAQAGRDATAARLIRGAGVVGGVAAVAYDAGSTVVRASDLVHQHNRIGAASEIEHFASRNVSAYGLAWIGAEMGSVGGPLGSVGGGFIGGGLGLVAGDKLMDAYDRAKIYVQSDPQGRSWHYDPEQPHKGWTRTVTDAFAERGLSQTHQEQAPVELGDRLSYQASTKAVQLALGRPAKPDDPYTKPATGEDAALPGDPPWIRDAQTKQWSRSYVDAFAERGMSHYGVDIATPARAAQLDAAASTIVANNRAQEPRSIAERYRTMYEHQGWKRYGPMPEGVADALNNSVTSRLTDGIEAQPHEPRDGAKHQTQATGTERVGRGRTESTIRIDHPDHPGYSLFKQAQAHVEALDAQRGRTPDAHSRNLAAYAAVTALANGITRIDALLPDTRDGSSMFIAQHTSPLKRVAEMRTIEAINTPLEQSSAAFLQVAQQQNPSQQQHTQMRDLSTAAQTPSAPQMRV